MGFVAQRSGMENVGPFFFSGTRMILGAATLFIILAIMALGRKVKSRKRMSSKNVDSGEEGKKASARDLIKGGLACGGILFFAGAAQQIGLVFTTASKAGFLTALYIVLVPILGIFLRHKTHWNTWVSVLVAAVGLYFLCMTGRLHIQIGDLAVLIGAVGWATHILVIDHFVAKFGQTDVIRLCALQFLFSGIFAFICMPFFDGFFNATPLSFAAINAAMISLLYAGIISTGVGFTLQAIGQRYANPSAASIIMSLESVFAAVGGAMILHERMSARELFGCALMFAAVILAQLPIGNKSAANTEQIAESISSD
jgi:drug/metabolite transporter (DMT)-like permease